MGGTMDENDKYTLLRMELGKLLGYDLMGQLDASDEELVEKIGKRLMPEGMEWPRFEDGELVKIGDFIASPESGERREVDCINFFDDAWYFGLVGASSERLDRRERVKRPPVLAADGEPLEAGQTVWDVESGIEYEVVGIHVDEDSPVRVMRTDGSHLAKAAKPSTLTHEQPDTWERIEADCSKCCIEYCDEHGLLDHGCNAAEGDASTRHCTDCGDSCEERMARDLVRRAKKLAGVEA